MKKLITTSKSIRFLAFSLLIINYSCDYQVTEKYEVEPQRVCCPIDLPNSEISLETRMIRNPKPIIVLSKTGCLGYCPIYTIKVFEDGSATLDGLRNMSLVGQYKTKVSSLFIQKVQCKAIDIGFYDLKEIYPDASIDIFDAPSVTISISSCNRRKTILDRSFAPEVLKDFETWLSSELMGLEWELATR